MPDPRIPDTADPPAAAAVTPPAPARAPARPGEPESTARKCPECGAEFDGVSVTHASDTLAGLREDLAAVKKELADEKAKAPAVAPAGDPPALPAQAGKAKKRGGILYGKHRAA